MDTLVGEYKTNMGIIQSHSDFILRVLMYL